MMAETTYDDWLPEVVKARPISVFFGCYYQLKAWARSVALAGEATQTKLGDISRYLLTGDAICPDSMRSFGALDDEGVISPKPAYILTRSYWPIPLCGSASEDGRFESLESYKTEKLAWAAWRKL